MIKLCMWLEALFTRIWETIYWPLRILIRQYILMSSFQRRTSAAASANISSSVIMIQSKISKLQRRRRTGSSSKTQIMRRIQESLMASVVVIMLWSSGRKPTSITNRQSPPPPKTQTSFSTAPTAFTMSKSMWTVQTSNNQFKICKLHWKLLKQIRSCYTSSVCLSMQIKNGKIVWIHWKWLFKMIRFLRMSQIYTTT